MNGPDKPFAVDVVLADGVVTLIMSQVPMANIHGNEVCAFSMDSAGARTLAGILARNADLLDAANLEQRRN